MWAEEHSPFGLLPVELKWKIFGFLKIPDKKKSRLVCAHWLAIIDEKLKCRAFLTDNTQSWILSGYRCHLKSLTIQSLTKVIPKSSLPKTLPKIDKCVIGRGNSVPNILNLLSFYSNHIDRLQIQNLSLSTIKSESLTGILRNTKWSNLSSLSVTMGPSPGVDNNDKTCKMHANAGIQLMKSLKTIALKSLTINFSKGSYFEKPWEEIFDFILTQRESLRELKLGLIGKPQPPPLKNFKQLAKFSDLKLKKFGVKFDTFHIPYANDLCLRMKGFVQLDVEMDHNSLDLHPGYGVVFGDRISALKLPEILDLHVKNLKALHCQCSFFDIGLLRRFGFDSLKILEIEMLALNSYSAGMPSLHSLRKFSLFVTSRDFGIQMLLDSFVNVVNQMPNLEEVDLMKCDFTDHHLRIFKYLRRIRKLTVGPVKLYEGKDTYYSPLKFTCCFENPRLSWMTEKRTFPKFLDSFNVAIIKFPSAVVSQ